MGELICPNCGSKVKLPEHSSMCVGMTFSKESNGTHYLNMETNNNTTKENKSMMSKEQEREAILKATGIDISKYFNVNEKVDVPVVADDEIKQEIYANGYVKNTKLHRRWVMAQMFRMINHRHNPWDQDGYNNYVKCLGYKYTMAMTLEELRVQTKLFASDKETFEERNSFFNKGTAVSVAKTYYNALSKYLNNDVKKKNCKGLKYITYRGKDIFVDDIYKKVLSPLATAITRIERAFDINDVYNKFLDFVRIAKKNRIPWNSPISEDWIDAYKGAGAYYTLRNMVQFHNCFIRDYKTNVEYRGTDAVKYLESHVDSYKGEGWRFMAMLRKCIADNDFHFGE